MNWKKQLPSLALVLLPFLYLIYLYPSLPDVVPTHWGISGEPDDWSGKASLWWIIALINILPFLIFFLVGKYANTERLEKMGNKFHRLAFILQVFMCMISLFLLYSTANNDLSDPSVLLVIIGLFISALGNFFKTIQPNYFIGIRTPWTLKSESVWKKTHRKAGIMWFIGGILIAILALILPKMIATITVVTIVLILAFVAIITSYIEYKKEKKNV